MNHTEPITNIIDAMLAKIEALARKLQQSQSDPDHQGIPTDLVEAMTLVPPTATALLFPQMAKIQTCILASDIPGALGAIQEFQAALEELKKSF